MINYIPSYSTAMALPFAFLAAAPLLCMRRHMYHAPTDRYGLHRSHSAAISSGLGRAGSLYSSCTPLRTPRSPDGSTSGRCSEKIMNMWTVHSPTPFTLVPRGAPLRPLRPRRSRRAPRPRTCRRETPMARRSAAERASTEAGLTTAASVPAAAEGRRARKRA
uniref:Uncharacterized protein n=1 Tax=Oryza brachyantha TaxID=4533 RepID=J3M9U1_ORYBR